MKIDFNASVKRIDGQPLIETNQQGEAVQATFKVVVVNAVLAPSKNDDGVMKVRKYQLAHRVYDASEAMEISLDEAKLIKDCITATYGPLIVGQVDALLEGK